MIAIDIFCRVITCLPGALGALFVLLVTPFSLPAQTFSMPVSRPGSWNTAWATADLDGDRRPDLAVAELAGTSADYRINIRLSSTGQSSHFDIHLPNVHPGGHSGLTISAQDVDGDQDLDLVITSGIARIPVGVWLNDGAGNFTQGDSSLYPERIWQGWPKLFSRGTSHGFPNARPEQSRSGVYPGCAPCCQVAIHLAPPLRDFPCPTSLFLPGPWRVRPPPAV